MGEFGILTESIKRKAVSANIEPLSRGPLMLIGPAGTGKTHMVYDLGRQLCLPVYKFACTPMATAADLIGGNQADPYGRQPLWWVPGPALMAMGYGLENPHTGERPPSGILLLDDLHLALDSDVMAALFQVLDVGPGGTITLPTGEQVVRPGLDKCRIVATANGEIDQFPEPIRSRFAGSVLVNEPSAEMLDLLTPGRKEAKAAWRAARAAGRDTSSIAIPPHDVVAKAAYADYLRSQGPLLTFRHWLNLSQLAESVGLATAIMVVTDCDAALSVSILQALAASGMHEAGVLLTQLSDTAPSGAPGGM